MLTQATPIDAIAAVSHPHPYPYYASLVAEKPFFFDETLDTWIASSAEAVTAVLTSDLCGVRPAGETVPQKLVGSEAGDVFRHFVRVNDGHDHRRVKQAVAAAIGSIKAPLVMGKTFKYARSLLQANGLPATFTHQLSSYVIADLLGVSAGQLRWMSGLIHDFVRCVATESSATVVERGKVAAEQLSSFFRSLLDELDVQSSSSLLAAVRRELLQAGCDDADVAVANAIGFLFQAYEASAGLIGNCLLALSAERDVRDAASGDRGLSPSFVAEVIRYDSPVQNTRRYAHRSGSILGAPIRSGEAILVLLAAANRDPKANARADSFEVDRRDRRTFTFGLGPHACPGEILASTIALEGAACVIRSGVDVASLAKSVRYRRSPNVRSPEFAR